MTKLYRQSRISEFDRNDPEALYTSAIKAEVMEMIKWIGHGPPFTMREMEMARKEIVGEVRRVAKSKKKSKVVKTI